ncbi:immunoglobulin I-set domain protein [Streptomyces caniscabiei]|uniref:immunoglobulin I-set domain protein n=1 Tax=Streptomyces caniscabiei TaxID=2746961 RepID=UPI0029BEDFD9|nr:immunoglobulin I-set domain protein [Streptomyces caniscabiei]MDX2605511.1 immunoglobulin I-set domain protein [Streptomyces caniscabiei]MDX2735878.1 immunoglobulin I-set domain protein [Streptomyces caniscabiei]MDX2781975.1 immunoglobulin I-set domain protein [Streptomyces caniscabiei]
MRDDRTDRRPGRPAGPRLGRPAALLGALALVAATVTAVTVSTAAQAADTPKTGLGSHGQKLTVSASANLDPDGEKLRVTGSGYDTTKAIYVALCKDNGDGKIPSPCIGGADETGTGSSSHWIVPEGDPYEGSLAVAWGAGGTFDVEIDIEAEDNGVDCAKVVCSVVTRVDHRNSGDRSQDVRVPVRFAGQDTGGGDGGGEGEDVPAGTVGYVESAAFPAAGKVNDLLLHPESGKLYAGSDNFAASGAVDERGLHALDPANGKSLGHTPQFPGTTGTLGPRAVVRIAAPLAGDGAVFQFALRGVGTAKAGDPAAAGKWIAGANITGIGAGTKASTVLVAQGAQLSEVDIATAVPLENRTLTLDGGSLLGVDTAHDAAWSVSAAGGTLRRVDTRTFTVTASAELTAPSVEFVEADPATGNVWVGSGDSVLVHDKDGKLLKTIEGPDEATDIAFDTATGRAFVVWQDDGSLGDGSDGVSNLGVYDTATYAETATRTRLEGNDSQNGAASVAVAPGGTTVYVSSPTEGEITKLDRRMSPKVTQTPTDRTVAPGDEVSFVAAAEGTPAPTVTWEVSTDGAQTWSAVEGATKNTYTFKAKAAHDGYQYRAVFKNAVGTTRTAAFTLTVTGADDSTGGGDGGGDGGNDEPSGAKTVTGSDGQKLTVTPVNNLATENQTLKVTGSGYDEKKGIYVALCVDNGAGELPSPCIGGVDMTGESHSSAWISSNPPDYGEELATPYEDGGAFEVELTVDAKDEYTDCFKARCVLATRADHTLSGDRSQDVKVPVAFVGQDPVDTDDDGGETAGATSTGGATSGGSTSGGTGSTGTTGASGGTGGTTTTGGGGSLAATGLTVLGAAASAAALTVTGWILHRRARKAGQGTTA